MGDDVTLGQPSGVTQRQRQPPSPSSEEELGDLGTAEIDEGDAEAAELEEQSYPAARDIPAGGVTVPETVPDTTEWRCHILQSEKLVPLDRLCYDKSADYGQVRPLRDSVVKYYVQRLLTSGEPVRPVDIFVKLTSGTLPCCVGNGYANICVTNRQTQAKTHVHMVK